MQSRFISIVTVTLNPGNALLRTIESIKSQTCHDFEHIIKDGGSHDGSVARHAVPDGDYRPTVIVEADKGIYDAMNQGMQHATGKYVLFLNAGDCFCDPDTLAAIAQAASCAPHAGLLYGDYRADTIDALVRSPGRLTSFTLYRNTLCHQACILAREQITAAGGFDASMRILADYDLLLRVMLTGIGSHYLGHPLVCFQGGGVSANPANLSTKRHELTMVRRRHFSFGQRLLYGTMLALTLPGLRNRLMQEQGPTRLKRAYVRIANFWNT